MEIYIIRHGETPWNEKKKLQGSVDIELNENGKELARVTGKNLADVSFDKIYSSPLKRAYETATLIRGDRDIEIETDNRLREIDFGGYEGRNAIEMREDKTCPFHHFFSEPELYQVSGDGESLEEVCERTAQFMKEVIEPQVDKYNRIMIVGHGAMNKGIMCHALKHGIKEYWSGGLQANCGVIIVTLDENGYNLIDENKTFY